MAATVMVAPALLDIFVLPESDPNDSWQRGVVVLPVVFLVTVFLCHAVASRLLSKGFLSMGRFTFAAFIASGVLALVLAAPAVGVGSFVGLYSLQTSIATAALFSVGLAFLAAPAALVWWLIAGQAHA
ncbi:MAG: hypothetical protein ACT4QA_21995 [Panacagrimonas sp.]